MPTTSSSTTGDGSNVRDASDDSAWALHASYSVAAVIDAAASPLVVPLAAVVRRRRPSSTL